MISWYHLSSKLLPHSVIFRRSIDDSERTELLQRASGRSIIFERFIFLAILYTPANEHFGIVPLEVILSRCHNFSSQ